VRSTRLSLIAALAMALPACSSPESSHPDLSGHWRGEARIPTTGLPTPLNMDLTDMAGILTGSGGGVDCRVFATCGSFFSYMVRGSHTDKTIILQGITPEGRSWTATGTLGADGRSMSGALSSADFPNSPWSMSRT